MKPLLLLVFFIGMFLQSAKTQTANSKDSLLKAFNNCATDTGKITLISKITLVLYNHSSYDSVLDFAGKGLTLAIKTNDKKRQAAFYQWLGIAQHYKGNYEGELANYLLALHIDEDINNKKGISAILGNIGSIYYDNLKDNDKALDYYNRSIQIKNELGDKNGAAIMYNNVGNIYTDRKDYERAIDYESRSLTIFKENGDKDGEARTLNYLGNIYTFKQDYEQARQYRLLALALGKSIHNREIETDSDIGLGLVYRNMKRYPDAISYLSAGLTLSRQIGFKLGEKNALEGLANTEEAKQNYKAAWDYKSAAIQLGDSLLNAESNKRMAELQVKYETEKKEKEIQQLGKDNAEKRLQLIGQINLLFYSIATGIVLVLAVLMLYIRYRTVQQRKIAAKELEMSALKERQQKELLHTIVITQEQEREKLAGDLHDGLGQMLTAAKMNLNHSLQQMPSAEQGTRGNIQSSLDRVSEALEESKSLASGLLPLKVRDQGLMDGLQEICTKNNQSNPHLKINFYAKNIPGPLPSIVEINIYRICQELITNVIKHSKATVANLQLFYRDKQLVIQMEDNGIGFSLPAKSGKGLGLKNIQSRVQLLAGDLITDTEKGASFIIHIPITNQ